jgi:hypothetical protein
MTDTREAALAKAAAQFRKSVKRADDIKKQASDDLTKAMKTAYDAGMKKADMLRVTNQVWSRTWLDKALKPKDIDAK